MSTAFMLILSKWLVSCMILARVTTAWSVAFMKKHGLQSLEDVVYVVEHGRWVVSLRELDADWPELKDNRLALPP